MGQRLTALATPFTNARTALLRQQQTLGELPFASVLQEQAATIERTLLQDRTLGILAGGLDTWTASALAFLGIESRVIDPSQISPYGARRFWWSHPPPWAAMLTRHPFSRGSKPIRRRAGS